MNRQIKFRGKRLDNGKWVYGYLADGYYINDINAPVRTVIEVDSHTVGQFTGLKDRNGKEIYEGDIVMYGDDRFLTAAVRFGDFNGYGRGTVDSYSFGWYMDVIQCQNEEHAVQQPFSACDGVLTYWPAYTADIKAQIEHLKVEVVGNIHDNPELLNGK